MFWGITYIAVNEGTEQTVTAASPSLANDKNTVIIIRINQVFPMHLKANDFNKQN